MLNGLAELTDLNQESPTLDLVNDCFQFVNGFFEVISKSAPHIYHSALFLSPTTSIVQKLYSLQAKPLARAVQGLPTLWDPSITNTESSGHIRTIAWSPCSKLIAIGQYYRVVVLDTVTLERLHTMHLKNCHVFWEDLIFSPDGHFLTGCSEEGLIANWDLQTGGLISTINTIRTISTIIPINTIRTISTIIPIKMWTSIMYLSMSYSECGTMIGVLLEGTTIKTYNVLSGKKISSHSVKGLIANIIWTHGECLRFATEGSGSITIWEIGFTSDHAPIQVGSLSIPDNFSQGIVLLPALSWLAFIFEGRIIVWDAQHHKILLDSTDVKGPGNMSFSPDGRFFVCGTVGQEFHLWKKSPDGYLSHQKFTTCTGWATPVISPDGELIISFCDSTLQLWHTADSSTLSLSISVPASQHTNGFLLEFSPNGSLVAVTQRLGNTVTVLDVRSGNQKLVIDTGMEVCGIGISESRVIVVGDGKIVTWEIPAGDSVLSVQGNVSSNVQTTTFDHSIPIERLRASISPDLTYITAMDDILLELHIYDIQTGENILTAWGLHKTEKHLSKLSREDLGGFRHLENFPGFNLDGNRVLCATPDGSVRQWAVVRNTRSSITKLNSLGDNHIERPSSGLPWHSSCGYQVTDDGWILNTSGRHLLWLPHQWRLRKAERRWNGKFLGLFCRGLPEVVILELEV